LSRIQADRVAQLIQSAHPEVEIETVFIKSLGDKDKTTPITEMGQIGIFTKEIDEAVLSGTVDFSVHSLKDVGTQRPEGLIPAAIPANRADPRDIVFFRTDIEDVIRAGQPIRLGTSSPRRAHLIPPFLQEALPQIGQIDVQTQSLRGNVPTRLQKVIEGEADAVALAAAGISRLFEDPEGYALIAPLLSQLKMMVMPLTVCPGAPGQGALYIEAAAKNTEVLEILSSIHDAPTAAAIARERNILTENGGGCHQQFGTACVQLKNLPDGLLIIKGLDEDGTDISEWRWTPPARDLTAHLWDGTQYRSALFETQTTPQNLPESEAVFLTHSSALCEGLQNKRLFTTGTQSWLKAAKNGLWVEACADGFGFEFLRPLLASPMMQLPPLSEWVILTHAGAESTWEEGHVIPAYTLKKQMAPSVIDQLKVADHIYWASFSQYEALKDHTPANAHQACGAGKTADLIRQQGDVDVSVFPNAEEWRKWLKVS